MKPTLFHRLKSHFLPTAHNGFIPHFLREGQVLAMLGIGIALFGFVQVTRISNYFGLLSAEVYPSVVVQLTNRDRAKEGLPSLSINPVLEQAAKLKAEDMVKSKYFAHTSPEGKTPWYWFTEAGYRFIYAGENLAINYNDSEIVQKAWLDSPTHRANIMHQNFTEMGVAVARGVYNGTPTTFVVEMFGMPAARVIPVPPTVSGAQTSTVETATAPKTVAQSSEPKQKITVPTVTTVQETSKYFEVKNEDPQAVPAATVAAPAPILPWYKRLLLKSDRFAGLALQVIIIIAIIATAGMVAREYEKHHRKHMAYGTLLIVIMFGFLFVGRLGIFERTGLTASAVPIQQVYTNDWNAVE
jgi:hypothetical protein